MAGRFQWIDNDPSTTWRAVYMNKGLDGAKMNILKNSYMASWSAGTSVAPDGFNWTNGGGMASIARSTSNNEYGDYTAYIIHAGGGSAALLEQYVTDSALAEGGTYTVMARVSCNQASTARVYLYDSVTGYSYSSYHTGGGSYEWLSVTVAVSGSITYAKVGVAVATVGSATYIDNLALYRGEIGPDYMHNPADHAMGCYGYDTNGTFTNLPGAIREIPFIATGNLTAGATTYKTVSFTLAHGCEKILYVSAGAISFGTTDPARVSVNCDNYGGGGGETSFDVNLEVHTGTFTASEAYEIRGTYVVTGWDNYVEVFGA